MSSPDVYSLGPDHYTEDYANERWARAGGNIQSLVFYSSAIRVLQDGGWAGILADAETIHDYGCGVGDGAAFLQAVCPAAEVTGFDFINPEMARRRWPTLDFRTADLRHLHDVPEADVIWTSHTLEHIPRADIAVRLLRQACDWLVVVVPMLAGGRVDETHVGAERTEDWLKRICPPAIFTDAFNTVRRYRVGGNGLITETNLISVFQGSRQRPMFTETVVVSFLREMILAWQPKVVFELGSGSDTTPALRTACEMVGATFTSVDTVSSYADVRQDAVEFLQEHHEEADFIFSDAGGWDTRIDSAKAIPASLKSGGIVAFHDVQHEPFKEVLDSLGAVVILPPGLGSGSDKHGGLAVWRKP